ncbi:MAG TPA: ABC transporter permease [Planctomycetota bacterium]
MKRGLKLLGPFLGLLVVVLFFAAVGPPGFTSFANFKTIATQTVIVGLGAIGMTFVIVSAGIDLSVGSVIALVSVVVALVLNASLSPLLALLAGVAVGTLVGLVTGLLIVKLRVVPFIVTLGMLGIARGVAKWLSGQQKVNAPESWLGGLMSKTVEPAWTLLPPGVWLLLGLGALMALVLRRSVFGIHVTALGSNEDTARLCGVAVGRTKAAVYALGGLFAGLAGVMQFGRLGIGDPTAAIGLELNIIAAVVIGGGSLAGGQGSILGSLIGAFLMTTLANGCDLTDVPTYVQEILIGTIIVAAVALDRFRHRCEA